MPRWRGLVALGGADASQVAGPGQQTRISAQSSFIALSGAEAQAFAPPVDVQLVTSLGLDGYGLTYERYQQFFGAAQVLGGQFSVYRDSAGNGAMVIGAHYPDIAPTNAVRRSPAQARAQVSLDLGQVDHSVVELMIDPASGRYFHRVESRKPGEAWIHWIDASNGDVLRRYDARQTNGPGTGVGVKGDVKSVYGPNGVEDLLPKSGDDLAVLSTEIGDSGR